jgi:hypothetical protein
MTVELPLALQNATTFQAAGAGAAARSAWSKLREVSSVKDFGAIGDGVARPVSQWLTGGALDRGYASLAAIQADYPHVGALTDSIDWAGIQAACNDVFNNVGLADRRRAVHLPYGDYLCNRQVVAGHWVRVVGDGQKVSFLRLTAELGADVPFIKMSRGGLPYEHVNGLFDLGVDAQGLADIGVSFGNTNEGGGLIGVEVYGPRKKGILIQDIAAQNFIMRDFNVFTEYALDGFIGVHLAQGNHPFFMENATIGAFKADDSRPANSIGILNAAGAMLVLRVADCHFENLVEAIRSTGRTLVTNCDGHDNVDVVVHFGNGAGDGTSTGEGYAEWIGVGKAGGWAVKDSTWPQFHTTPVFAGQGQDIFKRRYAPGRQRGAGNATAGESSADIAGLTNNEFVINHGMPAKPMIILAQLEAWEGQVPELSPKVTFSDATQFKVRLWDGTANAWKTTGSYRLMWFAEL